MILWVWLLGCSGEAPSTEPVDFVLRLENVSAPGALHLFAPGVAILHDEGWALFDEGRPASDQPGLEPLAEDGDNAPLIDALTGDGLTVASFAARDDVTYADAPLLPGDTAVITLTATPGQRLTVAAMYGESNDVFASLSPGGIALFDDAGAPVVGDVSASLDLWDAGTEVNQEPGLGPDQPARQAAPDTGEDEGGVVSVVIGSDGAGHSYPPVDATLSLGLEVASVDTP